MIAAKILSHGRVVVATVLLLALSGALAWWTMPRQEDPDMRPRWGQLVVPAPGWEPDELERLVAREVERELAQVEGVKRVELTIRAGVVAGSIELDPELASFPDAWTDVRDALADLEPRLPPGVHRPRLDDRITDTHLAILAVHGAHPLDLRHAARELQRQLQRIDGVARVQLEADPHEEVVVAVDDATLRSLGLPAPWLAAQLDAASRIQPAGAFEVGERRVRLQAQTRLSSADEVAALPIHTPAGDRVTLSAVADVRHGTVEPATHLARFRGEPAILVSVSASSGVDAVRLGHAIDQLVAASREELRPVQVDYMLLQSGYVASRLGELTRSLAQGVGILALVLLLGLGVRGGLVVALSVPVVVLVSLGVYAAGGGVLHQMSIAAFVLALGLVVDNAIVLTEAIQRRLDEGLPSHEAALRAVRELGAPLFAATGTTVAAFVPMLLATGDTAAFTGSIPTVVILSLVVSWFLAVFFVPVVAAALLRPMRNRTAGGPSLLPRVVGLAVTRAPLAVLALAAVAVVTVGSQAGRLGQQFFPASDRAVVVVDLALPEGATAAATDALVRSLDARLRAHPDTVEVTAMVGESLPRFYYNLIGVPAVPHAGQLLVAVRSADDRGAVREVVRAWAAEHPEAQVIDRTLAQGPPSGAPVEVRLASDDPAALLTAANDVRAALARDPTLRDVRHDAGPGVPVIRLVPDDRRLAAAGLDRSALLATQQWVARGLDAGEIAIGDERIPIVLRHADGASFDPSRVEELPVVAADGRVWRVGDLAQVEVVLQDAVIHRRDQRRVITVSAELAEGATYAEAVRRVRDDLEPALPRGVRLELGGEAEGASEAGAALMRTLPFGVAMLLFFLLVEFNSFRRVAIVLVSVPLAATGVVPGLLLLEQPFGFMSLLGVLAVVGIVVNNAIVLISVIDDERRDGRTLDEALRAGIARRWRAILLTTATTVLGLVPLALVPSPLWPPLATAMISGIASSALLTLLVVPSLYRLLVRGAREDRTPTSPDPLRAAAPALLALVVGGLALGWISPSSAAAQSVEPDAFVGERSVDAVLPDAPDAAPGGGETSHRLTLHEAIASAVRRPADVQDQRSVDGASYRSVAARRAGRLPVVGMRAEAIARNAAVEVVTPMAPLTIDPAREVQVGAELTLPLLSLADGWDRPAAARLQVEAAEERRTRGREERAWEAADAWLRVVAVDREREAVDAQHDALAALLVDLDAQIEAGVVASADRERLRMELVELDVARVRLREARQVARARLAWCTGTPGADVIDAPPEALAGPEVGAQSPRGRADLRALSREAAALDRSAQALERDALPVLSLAGRWTWTSRDNLVEPHRAEAALVLEWTPIAGGARRAAADGTRAEADALRALEAELALVRAFEIEDAQAQLRQATEEVQLRTNALDAAYRQAEAARARYAAGALRLVDLLDAESVLRVARARTELARLDVVRAGYRLCVAHGGACGGAG